MFRGSYGSWLTEDEGSLEDALDYLAFSYYKVSTFIILCALKWNCPSNSSACMKYSPQLHCMQQDERDAGKETFLNLTTYSQLSQKSTSLSTGPDK